MATSIKSRAGLGIGLELLCGTYTHTAGAAEETLVVAGGMVYLLVVNGQVAANTAHQSDAPGYTTSISGALMTITIKGLAAVSDGTFCVLVGSAA